MTPAEAATLLGMSVRAGKIECPHGHRKGVVWCSTDARQWRCHDCGQFGDAVDLAVIRLNMTYAEAFRWAESQGHTHVAHAPQGFPTLTHVAESAALARTLDAGLLDPLIDWCEWRRLPWQVAHASGVRAGRASVAAKHPAARKDDGKLRWPFHQATVGTFWPVYHPAQLTAPILWRFRPLRPAVIQDRVIKCASMGGPMARASVLYRAGAGTLIICEGEPDWLVWCAARPAHTVVGLTNSTWKPEWAAFGMGCTTWAWVGHQCDHESRVRGAIAESATAQGVRMVVSTVPESEDWADRWAR